MKRIARRERAERPRSGSPKSKKEINDEKIGETVSNYTFEICQESLKTKNDDFNKYKTDNDFTKLINDSLIFDLSKKSRVLQKIIKLLNNQDLTHLVNFHQDFNKHIVQPRNAFGHVSPEIKDGKKILIPKRGSEIIFTDDKCIEIRRSLIEYLGYIELVKVKVTGLN